MKVAVINYGMGNLGSVCKALNDLHAQVFVAEHPSKLWDADRLVLPGVGGFSEGAAHLHAAGWTEEIRRQVLERHRPILGICLGMQLLATDGDEGGLTPGLDLIPGHVRRIDGLGCNGRIPHVGWNDIALATPSPLFGKIPGGTDFYFVHSYALVANRAEQVSATVDYGVPLTAAVGHDGIFGTQFHPEKSSKAGRALLKNFLDYTPC